VYPTRPSEGFSRIAADPGIAVHFLERLRVFHPVLAVAVVLVMLRLLPHASKSGSFAAKRLARLALILLGLQSALGAINILLSAPGWIQVVHLTVACSIWMVLVVLTAELWDPRDPSRFAAGAGTPSGHGRASGSSFEGSVTATRSMR
jgi:heme A synthase